jgi:PAS domain S-box-containing protein
MSCSDEGLAPLNSILDIEYFSESNILNLLPAAVYVCDVTGQIVKFNEKAVELWGRRPIKGDRDERFCGSYRLYYPDGRRLPHEETPVAACLKDGLPRKNLEVVIEKPDLSRITVNVTILPVKDKNGELVGMVNCFYDVTEQRSAQKELEWKTKELQDYVDNAAIGLHWVDENGIIKWANKAELEMLGYEAEEYIGHNISEFHLDQEKIDDILRRLSCNETLQAYESTLRCKDGSTRTVQISSNVFWNEGKFIHTRCFTMDITEQKKLHQAIKDSEQNYQRLIQTLDTPLYTTDAEGRVMLFNKAAADLWGREPEIGKDLWCGSYKILRTDGTELPLDSCPMAVCLKELRPVIGEEILVVRPDGTIRNVAPHPQPLFDNSGMLKGAINMLVDVTAIRETEHWLLQSEQNYRNLAATLEKKVEEKTKDLIRKNEELQKSEERYHRMVEEVEDYAIILLDKDGTILNWNKGAQKIKGYRDEEIIGKNFEVFYPKEDRENGVPGKLIKTAIVHGKAAIEGWRVRKDGSRFWGSTVITALHDDEGNVVGFTKVTRDLTEKKKAEDQLKEYSSELEFQNRELEQFAYAASHDMKEPLRKIHLYSAYVKDNRSNILDERSKDYLDRSMAAVHRMNSLIEDLLAYSRTTSTAENFEEVNLQTVVNEVISEQKDELEQKGITIEIGKLPTINGIPFQWKQLIYNLVTNSVKYGHPDRVGYILIESKTVKASEIRKFGKHAENSHYQITVSDNGVGFEQEYAEKIFEVFQRLNNPSGAKGSGIGLALCKKIVQNHKGFIVATGKPGEGAKFDIYLPTMQIEN